MNVIELYQNNLNNIEKFDKNINSNLNVKVIHDESKYDDEWLCKMEETIRYLDNILRNPNRFIVNDEEIVKIELARRITVDSIKHLSKNTNLIQDFNKKTGEVRPSKILNINKEESFNTYENRFIYTLINNMRMYIERKKNETGGSFGLKDEKSFNYAASSKMGKKKIDISLNMKSHLEESTKEVSLSDRITKLEEQIRDLTSSDVYKSIAKLHVAPVVSPIKKTNLILKLIVFVSIPCTILISTYSKAIVRLLFYRGAFDENSLQITSVAVSVYALAIVFVGMKTILFTLIYKS